MSDDLSENHPSYGFIRMNRVSGGTGRLFDWSKAVAAKQYVASLILAGGLNPENVSQAIKLVIPGIVVGLMFWVSTAVAVVEQPGIVASMKRSRASVGNAVSPRAHIRLSSASVTQRAATVSPGCIERA